MGILFHIVVAVVSALLMCSVAIYVSEMLTASNLSSYAKRALRQDSEGVKLLSEALQIAVTKKEGNVVSLSALRNKEKVAEIEIIASGISSDVYEGMKQTI